MLSLWWGRKVSRGGIRLSLYTENIFLFCLLIYSFIYLLTDYTRMSKSRQRLFTKLFICSFIWELTRISKSRQWLLTRSVHPVHNLTSLLPLCISSQGRDQSSTRNDIRLDSTGQHFVEQFCSFLSLTSRRTSTDNCRICMTCNCFIIYLLLFTIINYYSGYDYY